MPTLAIDVPDDVSRALTRQARALLLSQRRYVRAVLAAVAAQAGRDEPVPAAAGALAADVPMRREVADGAG